MLKYIDALICVINIYIFYENPNGLSLAAAVLMALCAIIEAIKELKKSY